jgi:hypothetical protein
MGRFQQNENSHGSLRDLQILINEKSCMLDNELEKYFQKKLAVKWVSPLKIDGYSEYRDEDFLDILGIRSIIKTPLHEFWPKNGPQWDALGKYANTIFIVEAKANIPELKSPGTKASNNSKELIEKSLNSVKKYLNVDNSVYWMGTYYQYINRIAHLYYLRLLNKIDAYLIFIYFVNDNTINGPKTIDEWKCEIKELHKKIGLKEDNILSKYILNIYINYNNIKK